MISLAEHRNQKASPKWYVIRTAPQADYLAASELQRNGYEYFSPRIKAGPPANGNTDAPLFPGYLFLKWNLEGDGLPSFLNAPHVSGWVNFDGVAPAVPDEVVAELAQRVDTINSEGGLWRRFKPGDQVRVVSKAIESLAEVLEETRSSQARVKVLMQFMGRMVSAQVPRENLHPLGDHLIKKPGPPPRRTRGRGRWVQGFGPTATVSA